MLYNIYMSAEAIFAYNGDESRIGGNLSGLPQLFELLREREVSPFVSLEGEEAFQDDGIRVHELQMDGSVIAVNAPLAYGQAGVLMNRLNRSLGCEQMPTFAELPPAINENRTRDITNEKDRVYEEILRPLNLGIATMLLTPGADIHQFFEENAATSYILKPNRGTGGKDVQTLTREEALKRDDVKFDGNTIIQPKYDFTGKLSPGLKAYDTLSQEMFENVRSSPASKELRIYGFHSSARTDVFAVGRAIVDRVDEWFFIDPDTLPSDIFTKTEATIRHTANLTGAVAMLGALDFGYGNIAGEESSWHAIELNSKQPYVIGYDKHAAVAQILRSLFADQISATITQSPSN
jgi:hypothetical protein